jgi:hypothetical protein
MHLSQLKAINQKAYELYVEMLIEDCQDEFAVIDDTIFVNVVLELSTDPRSPMLFWDRSSLDGSWEQCKTADEPDTF